ncbi:NlpC/P60 family protein [Virgibacillus halophilus]|uniref:C40 family peptidase n=1 Tax=Tigheibacillus halophilus TaxID=361280 RepID=UPI00363E5F74
MKKTIMTLATVSVVGLSSALFTQPIHAETLDQLHSKQSEIQNERSSVKSNLSKSEAKITKVLMDLEKLQNEISKTEAALQKNSDKIGETKQSIKSTKNKIDELQKSIDKRFEILKERASSYQKSGGNIGYLDVLLGSKSFSDFIGRVSAVSKITESDQDLMKQIEKDKKQVEKKLGDLKDMQAELKGIQQTILSQKKENESKKVTLKDKKAELEQKKDELKIKDSKLASLEADVKESIAEATAPAPEVQVASTTAEKNDADTADSPAASEPAETKTTASTSKAKATTSKTTTSTKQTNAPKTVAKAASNPAPAAHGGSAISAGYSVVGTPYVWGGKSPGGFDCSGFVSWAYGQAGVSLPSSTSAMSGVGTKVSYSNIKPGDLVFFNTYKHDGHVGIYVGGGNFIGAQDSGVGVASMNNSYWKSVFSGHVRRVN